MSTTVTTQAELDAAIAAGETYIIINSPDGVWLRVSTPGSSHVVAWGSSHVVAWESSHVVARGSSHVVAWGSSHVEAWESSHVVASDYVAVHMHSASATIAGGHVIDITEVDLTDPTVWTSYHGLKAGEDGRMLVYKAVDQDLVAGQGRIPTTYRIGETITATDWSAQADCGHGLHFSPSPAAAKSYFQGDGDPRYLVCSVAADFVPLDGKLKAPSCVVLREVTLFGEPVELAGAAK